MKIKISWKDIPEEVENAFNEAWYNLEMNVPEAVAYALAKWPGISKHEAMVVRDNAEGYDLRQLGVILPMERK